MSTDLHGDAGPSRLAMWVQAFLIARGWHPRRCVFCREHRWIRGSRAVCHLCRRQHDLAGDAAWLNVIRHLNQARSRR